MHYLNANLGLRGLFFNEPKIINLNINLVSKENNFCKFNNEWQKKYQDYSLNLLLQNLKMDIRLIFQNFINIK